MVLLPMCYLFIQQILLYPIRYVFLFLFLLIYYSFIDVSLIEFLI